jgi:hypothetical protein
MKKDQHHCKDVDLESHIGPEKRQKYLFIFKSTVAPDWIGLKVVWWIGLDKVV